MAEEYFVNQPEYQRIMNLIAQLGGLDLDDLLQRMTAVETQLSALETWQGSTNTTLETIAGDIDTIEGNVSDMESAETARNEWHDVLAWGNYLTADQTLLLMDDTTNYDFLVLIAGFSSGENVSGNGFAYMPGGYASAGGRITVDFWVGTNVYKVTVQFVDGTHIKILNCTNSSLGLRSIVGKKRG